jgi:hypothetical protein
MGSKRRVRPATLCKARNPASIAMNASAAVKTPIAQLVMQDARNDQLFRPVRF